MGQTIISETNFHPNHHNCHNLIVEQIDSDILHSLFLNIFTFASARHPHHHHNHLYHACHDLGVGRADSDIMVEWGEKAPLQRPCELPAPPPSHPHPSHPPPQLLLFDVDDVNDIGVVKFLLFRIFCLPCPSPHPQNILDFLLVITLCFFFSRGAPWYTEEMFKTFNYRHHHHFQSWHSGCVGQALISALAFI